MIVDIIAMVLALGLCCVCAYCGVRIRKNLDMIGNLGLEVSRLKVNVEILQNNFAELKVQFDNREEDEQKAMVEALERKWEQATQAIQNFDPYKLGDG